MNQSAFLPRERLQQLIDLLRSEHADCVGPQIRDGAIVFASLERAEQLPLGYHDRQRPGSYRLEHSGSERAFAWANGPQALKPLVFEPEQPIWRSVRSPDGSLAFHPVAAEKRTLAVIGVRACDLAALALQDAHFLAQPADPWYAARRESLFLVAVHCTHPAETCFCVSTGDGPSCSGGFDLALHELNEGFIMEVGSDAGQALFEALDTVPVASDQRSAAKAQQARAVQVQRRRLPAPDRLAGLMEAAMHPHWDEVAGRCLSCGNCTAVCPSCFCNRHEEVPALDTSQSAHARVWDSCFSAGHSLLHGRPLRAGTAQRYRQWLTHKLAGWQAQYGRSGCVGCGRCISWCPVGIDLTAEVDAILGEAHD